MLNEMKQIVKEAGTIIRNATVNEDSVKSKGGHANFVTHYDVEVQNFLYNKLSALCPEASFLGEEDLNQGSISENECFIIDPIDGTTNFIFDNRQSAISVALMKNGDLLIGVVYNPYQDELFFAEKGKGAFLNDRPLYINNRKLKDGLVAFGTSPYYMEKADASFRLARELLNHSLDLRRSGSAALDLCYIAASRFTLFFEFLLSPWDYAAASLIIREAGGMISTIDKGKLPYDKPCSVLAASPAAYEEFYTKKIASVI